MKKFLSKDTNWNIFCFVICIIVVILTNKSIIYSSFLEAEDGPIFIDQAIKYGFQTFLFPYGGYFCTLSRIFAIIAVFFGKNFNSAILMTNVMKYLSIFFAAFVASYFSRNEFSTVIKSKYIRLLFSIVVILVMSDFAWMLYNSVSIHWWCGLLLFFVSLNLIHKKVSSIKMLPIIFISLISTPSALPCFFAIIYYVINYDKKRKLRFKKLNNNEKVIIFSMVFAIALECVSIIFLGKTSTISSPSFSIHDIVSILYRTLLLTTSSINFVFGTNIFLQLNNSGLSYLVGVFMWLFAFYCGSKKGKKEVVIYAFISILFLYFMILYKKPNYSEYYKELIGISYQVWYNSLPAIIAVFTFYYCLYNFCFKNNLLLEIFTIFLICFAVMYVKDIDKIDFSLCNQIDNVESSVDFSSKVYAKIHISPSFSNWYIYIPVKESYCINNDCINNNQFNEIIEK